MRGNYGNQRGGNSRGNNGGRGNFRGQGRGGNNRGGGATYLRSSTFIRKLKFENKQEFEAFIDDSIAALEDLQFDAKGVEFPLAPMGSEELAMTYTAAKVDELKGLIEDAENDPQGDGGIRITTYLQHKVNQDTGEEFDGASTMIVGKFPPRNQQKGGRGGFKGRNNGGGRRNYNQEDDGGDDQQETRSTKGSGTRGSRKTQEADAPEDTQDTHGETSQQTTSHSEDTQYEDSRW